MRPVNLLPARYRPRTGGSENSKTAYVTLGVLALLVLAVFGYVTTANKVSSTNSKIAETRQRLTAAETQAVTLQGFGDFAGIKEARLSAVKSLATARTDWERLFRELAHVLPPRVWLTGFSSNAGEADGGGELGPTLTLKGCADSHERIADAMIRLRELHVAEDVELTQTVASEKEKPTGFGAPAAAEASDESGCGGFYSFEVSVTMAAPSGGAEPADGARSGTAWRRGMTVNARDKKILLIIVPLALVLGYWFLLLAPKREAASAAATKLAAEQEQLAEAESRASTVRAAKESFARDYAAVVAIGKAIPTSVDMPSLLVQLEQAARGTGIELDGVTMGERTAAQEAAPTTTPPEGGTAPSGEPPQSAPGQAAADAQTAADTASTPPPTSDAAGAATAPSDPAAAGGSAPAAGGLESVSLEFKFKGDFFELANFFHRLKRFVYVKGDNVRVRGRLMTIDGVEYTAEPETFPALTASVRASVYLTPKTEGVTAGATPAGPAAPAAPAPVSTASTETAPPTPTAATTP